MLTVARDLKSELIDLTAVNLMVLHSAEDSQLARALDRVVRAAKDPEEAISAFSQSI